MGEEAYWQALLNDSEMASDDDQAADAFGAISGEMERCHPDDEAWQQAMEAMASGEIQTTQIVGYNRGGLLVEWNSLRGFAPASHLVCLSPFVDADARRAELAERVGSSMDLRIIEVDCEQSRLVFSERATISDEARESALLAELTSGQVRQGTVTNVCSFGAFIDLGGLEGLIHISEISWGRVNHPGDVLHSGQSLDVYIIGVNPDQKRVALSLKRLSPDPWATAEERYRVGQLIEGEVTNVVSFGAFVRVEDGLEGLIHVSELAEGTFLHPRNVVHEGDVVVAYVLNIDSHQRRMGLSLRRTSSSKVPPVSNHYREMSM